jgi:hypothetical protein
MDKKVHYGRRRPLVEDIEDSFDSSWLSSSISSQYKPKLRLDLSNIVSFSELPSNRTSISISQSIEDMSFFRSELSTPRIVKGSHDIITFNSSKIQTNKSFLRTKPKIITLKNRTIPENILLDKICRRQC